MIEIKSVVSGEQIANATLLALKSDAGAHITAMSVHWFVTQGASSWARLVSANCSRRFVKNAYHGVAETLEADGPFRAALEELEQAALQRVLADQDPDDVVFG